MYGARRRYAQYSFLPQSFEIHWLSIINSFVLVRRWQCLEVLLLGAVALEVVGAVVDAVVLAVLVAFLRVGWALLAVCSANLRPFVAGAPPHRFSIHHSDARVEE